MPGPLTTSVNHEMANTDNKPGKCNLRGDLRGGDLQTLANSIKHDRHSISS